MLQAIGNRHRHCEIALASSVGLYDKRDTAGPMARSVTDLVQLLDAIAGIDPADPATTDASGNIPPTYMAFLKRDGAVGRRIGVLRQASRPGASDPQVLALFDPAAECHEALARLEYYDGHHGVEWWPNSKGEVVRDGV
jgi:Asp-tRNA(Asn)/Glu-tRNA(Gln) amidotransferase A subunit family amidase